MNTTLATTSLATGGDIHVIAETPQEMSESNQRLIEWCDQKIKAMRVDQIELEASFKAAVKRKWKSSVLQRHAKLAKKRVEFYRKMKEALEAGFYIVPNFPVSIFAIRTSKEKPLRVATIVTSSYEPNPSKDQQTESLDQGEGDYVSPLPIVQVDGINEVPKKYGEGNETVWNTYATGWDEVAFPLCMAKPRIMEAVGRAMEMKLFDDLGVLSDSPDRRRGCGDPIIVARILDPRPGWNKRYISFIIAWALDTSTL